LRGTFLLWDSGGGVVVGGDWVRGVWRTVGEVGVG